MNKKDNRRAATIRPVTASGVAIRGGQNNQETDSEELSSSRIRVSFWIATGLFVGVIAIYAPAITFDFVDFDDYEYVYRNPHVLGGLTSDDMQWAFTARHASNWHPLTWLSHMLDVEMYGCDWAGGHHLTNILLHAAVAVTLYFALTFLTGQPWPSAFTAAVFAFHPLRVESVAWVSERKDVLSGFFFLLLLLQYTWYTRKPSALRYLLTLAVFAQGLMCKPMLVTAPFVLLLLDYWPLQRTANANTSNASLRSLPSLVIEKIPFLALAAAASALTIWAQTRVIAKLENLTFGERVANAAVSYAAYIGQFFWPTDLAALYPHPGKEQPALEVVGACTLLFLVTLAAFVFREKRPYLLVGWLWFLGMLVPVIGLVQVGVQARADRYTYLPQIGLIIAITWLFADASERLKLPQVYLAAAAVGVLVALSIVSSRQTDYWRDGLTLFTHALECTRKNEAACRYLGTALQDRGRFEESIPYFERSIDIRRGNPIAHAQLSISLYRLDRLEEAQAHAEQALRIDPRYAPAAITLGVILARRGDFSRAVEIYEHAASLDPDNVTVHANLGIALYRLRKPREAQAEFARALSLDPDHLGALRWAAWIAATSEDSTARSGARALAWGERAYQLAGDGDAMTLEVLAAAFAEAGRFDEAIATAEKAIKAASASGKDRLADKLRAQLGAYQSNKVLREAPSDLD